MTCREFDEFILDYLGGELPVEIQGEFEKHLSVCPPCVTFLETYQKTMEIGHAVCTHPEDTVPAEVPEELIRAIVSSRIENS